MGRICLFLFFMQGAINMAEDFNLGTEIVTGVKEVFSTMLMMELKDHEVVLEDKVEVESNLTSMIGLGGGIRGVLAIHCPSTVATAITGGFLGMEVDEIDEDVKDAIGEIANMVAGNLKVSYAKINLDIELAIPTSVVGDSFSIGGFAGAKRVTVPLELADQTFLVELMYVENG